MTNWTPNIAESKGPRYIAIVEAIKSAIESKELLLGQQLPTHRDLAHRLNVSVQTVSRAYAEAERRSLVSAEIGRGTFVQFARLDNVSSFIADDREEQVIDFTQMVPIVSEEHAQALRATFAELSRDKTLSRMLAYRPAAGTDFHRQIGSTWLEHNGVSAPPSDVIITNGISHGLWMAMASLADPGDTIATDHLIDPTIISMASILKLRLYGLAIDEEGIIPEAFEEACAREPIKLLCTMPCYGSATASVMSEARRERIAQIARRHDLPLIEGDDCGPLMMNRPKPLWSFAPERTYYTTSFSRVITAALRTGYIVGPSHMKSRLISRSRVSGWMATTWTAEVAARWLNDGTAQMLIDWQRDKLKTRYAFFKKILKRHSFVAHPYSIHAWLSLPSQWRSRLFVEQARQRGVLVTPPDPFIVGRSPEPHAIRIAYGDTVRDDNDFERGLKQIGALLDEDPEPVHGDF